MCNQRINFCGPDVFMTPKLAICLVGDVPDKGNRRGKGELGRVECKHQPMPARFKTCPGRQLYQPLPLTGSGLARQYGNGPEGLPPRSRLIREPEVGKSDSAAHSWRWAAVQRGSELPGGNRTTHATQCYRTMPEWSPPPALHATDCAGKAVSKTLAKDK